MEAGLECKPLQAEFDFFRKNNTKLLNIWIHSGMALMVLMSIGFTYIQADGINTLIEKIKDTPHVQMKKGGSGSFKKYKDGIIAAGKDIKIDILFVGLGMCYGLSFVGAMILSINDAWKEEKKIKDALLSNNYKDFQGEPWKVFWVRDSIIFHTYQCDPMAFQNNDKFWNTINFKPDVPLQYEHDSNKIVVSRAYTLPAVIKFEIEKNT